jgi:hypothetical protein
MYYSILKRCFSELSALFTAVYSPCNYRTPITNILIVAYLSGDHSLKIQDFIGIVALQGPSALYSDRIDTVPYSPETFDRVLRTQPVVTHTLTGETREIAPHSIQ